MFIVKVLARLSTNMNLEFLLVDKRTRTFFYVGEMVIHVSPQMNKNFFFTSGKELFMLVDKLTSTRGVVANRYTDLNLFLVNCRGFLHTNTVPG